MITSYFVEFIFYSFLGWVWESIYCTVQNGQWMKRGFLFGPICPIYGSSVVLAHIVFSQIPILTSPDLPTWIIFLICMVGSAVMEFTTSYYLEQRFHAKWWDYSDLPFNIQGRICLPVSLGFGFAGVVIVKWVLPVTTQVQGSLPALLVEILSLIFAMVLGADFALTEASLSTLLKQVEEFKKEFDDKAEETYSAISQKVETAAAKTKELSQKVETAAAKTKELSQKVETAAARTKEFSLEGTEKFRELRELSASYTRKMTRSQRRILSKIKLKDTPRETVEGRERLSSLEFLRSAMNNLKKENKKQK